MVHICVGESNKWKVKIPPGFTGEIGCIPSSGASRHMPPALDTEESRFARRVDALSECIEFLSENVLIPKRKRTLVKTIESSFDAMVAKVRMDAVAAPHSKRPEHFRHGADWVENEIVPQLAEIIPAGISARCEHVVQNAGIPWVWDAAYALKREFDRATEKGGVIAIKTAFSTLDSLNKLENLAFYTGMNCTDGTLVKRKRIIDALCASTQSFDEIVDMFAEQQRLKRSTVKKYLKEIAYAAHAIELARIPKTYHFAVEALRYAVDSKQSGISQASLVRAGERIVAFPKEGDRKKMVDAYSPLNPAEIQADVDETLDFLAKAAQAKGRSMGGNPPRTWSYFQGLLGVITHFETEKLALVPPEARDSVKHWQLEYDSKRAHAIYCYEEAFAQVKELVDRYRADKNPDAAALIANLALPEEKYDELPLNARDGLDKYVEGLRVRVDRWMDHPSKRGLLPIPKAMKIRLDEPGLAPELARLAGNLKKGDHFYFLAKQIRTEYLDDYLGK